jgi:hypothetical protein
MQINLLKLREQMAQVKTRGDGGSGGASGSTSKGGGRWRSARVDRGGLRGYGDSVRKGAHKRRDRAAAREITNGNSGRRRTFKHNTHKWGVREVSLWLSALGLDQYVDTFSSNEITGAVLLDVGQSDLDYMQIKALGHRKVIMREIERLKRGKSSVDIRKAAAAGSSSTAASGASSHGPSSGNTSPARRGKRLLTVDSRSPPQRTADVSTGEERRFRFSEEISPQQRQRQEAEKAAAQAAQVAAVGTQRASPSSKRAVHWSQVKPISENEVTGSGAVPVNLADGQFDEAKQQEDFKAAVMAWRNGGARGPSSSSSAGAGSSLLSGSGGMWNNPLGDQGAATSEGKSSETRKLSEGVLDEAAERKKFQDAVAEWRHGGKPKQPHTSDASAGVSASESHTHASSASAGRRETSVFDGAPDEAAEHERFRRAVEDWREGKTGDGAASPGRKSAAVANSLLIKMANDDLLRRRKFEQEKKSLEEGLQRGRVELRRRREEAAAKLAASKYSDDEGMNAGCKVSSRIDTARARKYDTKKLWDMEIEY